ncbi:MAG TPA: 4Fe-4S dicluster domain-containing protein, partial [Gemmataceae bacterium]|nr:4Fe-4S dicluster domain-containing protein [Gemmataceae bacterium]
QQWEARLAQLAYQTVKESHIHVLWPRSLPDKNAVVKQGLFHVCPAHVYEARVNASGQVQVVVNFENCIKCETCWRTSDLVDWGRDGRHRFVYAVHSPAVPRLLADQNAAGLVRPTAPRVLNPWDTEKLRAVLAAEPTEGLNGERPVQLAEVERLLACLERKLAEFDEALDEEPRTVDRGRADYLQMLTRYAQNVAARMVELLRGIDGETTEGVQQRLLSFALAAAGKTEERTRHTASQRYSWAAADGRQLRQHHLAGMRRYLDLLGRGGDAGTPTRPWLRAEEAATALVDRLAEWRTRLGAVFPPSIWRELEQQIPLTAEQDTLLRDLLSQIPSVDAKDLGGTLHPPERKALLAELGRRDPSLAYRAACHLWARDLGSLRSEDEAWHTVMDHHLQEGKWFAFAVLEDRIGPERTEALFVPARSGEVLILLRGDEMASCEGAGAGLAIEPLATLGLRGAGLARLVLTDRSVPQAWGRVDHERLLRLWAVLSAADLTSIAFGMADLLCRRAIEQATGRVQFPGLFHDEDARDAIGKFGAIKKMVADLAARRYLIETLDHVLSPTDFSDASVERAGLVKALVAEALGTAPGSIAYNAGQIFGGTGYSEDDILSKYYRDAAAWRFLGPDNPTVFARRGERLLQEWDAHGEPLSSLPGEAELFDEVAQRKGLQGQLDALRVQRSRLRALVPDFLASGGRKPPDAAEDDATDHQGAYAPGSPQDAEVRDALGRQDAYLLGSKALLL